MVFLLFIKTLFVVQKDISCEGAAPSNLQIYLISTTDRLGDCFVGLMPSSQRQDKVGIASSG
jgi:hypothetical protein